ncbi:MAG: RNA-binding S4 domain-containing protein [Caldilineaceae bacterium]|nr:RNA-binding S4 domain-containing protein [Caldilineaceae bacterium]
MQPEEFIKLDKFLKVAQMVESGGQAKYVIQHGLVQVNGVLETRRGRKLRHGDKVLFDGEEIQVVIEPDDAGETG